MFIAFENNNKPTTGPSKLLVAKFVEIVDNLRKKPFLIYLGT